MLKWLQAPTFPTDEDKTRSALLLNVVLNTFIITLPIIILGILIGNNVERSGTVISIVTIAWLVIIGLRIVMLKGWVTTAGILTTLTIFMATTLSVYNLGTIRAPATSFYLLSIVLSGLVIGRHAIAWSASLCAIAIITFLVTEINGLLPTPNMTVSITQGVTFLVVFTIISILLYLAVQSIDKALSHVRNEVEIRKQAEKEMKRLNKQLENRNAELERFNYTISHELKSPIVTVKNYLGSITHDLQAGNISRAQKDIVRVSVASDNMQKTISDLLELSKIGRIINPPEFIDMNTIIQESLETTDGQLKSCGVKVNVTSPLPMVYGDHHRLREVIENLIDNAAKYMGDQKDPTIEIGVRKENASPIFYVKDNGIGIEESYQAKIFGLFEKLDSSIDGTGIGLALVKRIIKTHGGKIWVESEGLGKGSTFCFTIPENRKTGE